ncbi:aldolase/citrate lyase family protein [Saccharopolyspora gloriosae]|uniref:4-hydroxy-2-oxoheptanedioate aldolase n=1 Tax=Saccharopolyspora gloriosae TaxID=455344 RepID=A0A840NHY9_9PSEU|nr:aldolase/citrate lyase family protein [Saccharopolyspora gloriosae]MBB5069898.1 4-hydroxy-2-oxoheptanedioate aldolase [Saccharopolyspora gloriosae]
MTADFVRKIRSRETVLGYWVMLDAPPATERLARAGYDYVCLDGQHGLLGYQGVLNGLIAIDAAAGAAGVVRVPSHDRAAICRALDAGARGIIVPLVDDAEQAAAAVAATRYPPGGIRSYGPMRSSLRIGPDPAEADASVVVLAMIETPLGLANVESICATPGLDGVYIGPADMALAVGAARPDDPAVAAEFDAALARVRAAADAAGIAVGIHTPDGATAARRLAEGFTFASVSSDLEHLEQVARAHLDDARS